MGDKMAALEREVRAPIGFVAASTGPEGVRSSDTQPQLVVAENPDAIDVDVDEL